MWVIVEHFVICSLETVLKGLVKKLEKLEIGARGENILL